PAYVGEVKPLDDDDLEPLPVEYIGELRPLDPSEGTPIEDAGFPEQTVEGPVERTQVTAAPQMDSHDLPQEVTTDEESPIVIPVGARAGRDAPGRPGHPEEDWIGRNHPHTSTSFRYLLSVGAMSRSGILRALAAAEHHVLSAERYQWAELRGESHL